MSRKSITNCLHHPATPVDESSTHLVIRLRVIFPRASQTKQPVYGRRRGHLSWSCQCIIGLMPNFVTASRCQLFLFFGVLSSSYRIQTAVMREKFLYAIPRPALTHNRSWLCYYCVLRDYNTAISIGRVCMRCEVFRWRWRENWTLGFLPTVEPCLARSNLWASGKKYGAENDQGATSFLPIRIVVDDAITGGWERR